MEPSLKPIVTFSIVAFAILALSIPLLLGKVPPNCVYGIRMRKTLSSPEIWYKANRFGARCFIVSSLITLISCLFLYLLRDQLTFKTIHQVTLGALIAPLSVAILLILGYVKKL